MRLPARSLGRSGLPVNAQLFVTGARLRRRPAADGQIDDAQDPDALMQRKGDGASDPDRLAGLVDALAIDAQMAAVDQPLGKGAAPHQPDAMEVAVDPQGLTA